MKKGDLTIRVMLRHDDPALLEKLRHQPLVRCTTAEDAT